MFNHRARNLLLDRLHKGFVVTCIGVTGYGCYLLGWRFYRYFTVIRPERQLEDVKQQAELLAEGKEMSDSTGYSTFQDTATELKS